MVDLFVRQLDGCTYPPGPGYNCSCASEAMWLYRATQGRIVETACGVRRLTGDQSGGTNLEQMEGVSVHFGIRTGQLWRPGSFNTLESLLQSGRYGAIVQIGYSVIANTAYDCFGGTFRGGHAVFVRGGNASYAFVGDPGADGRRAGIPIRWQSYPWTLLRHAVNALPLGNGVTLAQEYGDGHVYSYLTPADPIIAAPTYKATVIVEGTRLWNDSTKRWVYSLAKGTVLTVRGAHYTKAGVGCFPVTGPAPYTGPYYVPQAKVELG